ILQKNREKVVANTPLDYVNLYEMCCSFEPDQRPTLDIILSKLNKLSGVATIKFIINKIAQQRNSNIRDENGILDSNSSNEVHSTLSSNFPI
ncbi:11491_t:CDS:2, partial [Racocetra persica]